MGQSKDIDPIGCSLPDWENLSDEERKEFSLLDRIQARIASVDWEQLEILQNEVDMSRNTPIDEINNRRVSRAIGMRKASYMAWMESITSESVNLILDKYLSTHAETETEKRWGDRYGRIIGGWDSGKQEPIIVYSATGGFLQGTRHNIADIPISYCRTEDDAAEVEEERLLLDELTDEDKAIFAGRGSSGDDEPF